MKKMIRFIDSQYNDLFYVENGKCIQIDNEQNSILKRCYFIDKYHVKIGQSVYHICQFAEKMKQTNLKYVPEGEPADSQIAWKIGNSNYLLLQEIDDGYEYTLLNKDFSEVDGGTYSMDFPGILDVRDDILEEFQLMDCDLAVKDYEDVLEQFEESEHKLQTICYFEREAEKLAIDLAEFVEDTDFYEFRDCVTDKEQEAGRLKEQILAGDTDSVKAFLQDMSAKDCDDGYIAEDLLNELEDFENRSTIVRESVLAMLKQLKSEIPDRKNTGRKIELER